MTQDDFDIDTARLVGVSITSVRKHLNVTAGETWKGVFGEVFAAEGASNKKDSFTCSSWNSFPGRRSEAKGQKEVPRGMRPKTSEARHSSIIGKLPNSIKQSTANTQPLNK